jgi:hypothetical protein
MKKEIPETKLRRDLRVSLYSRISFQGLRVRAGQAQQAADHACNALPVPPPGTVRNTRRSCGAKGPQSC